MTGSDRRRLRQVDGVECPYCSSTETTLESPFGSTVLKSQYYCRDCGNVFEQVKWDEE